MMKMVSHRSHIQPSSGADVGHVEAEGDELVVVEDEDELVVAEDVVTAAAATAQKHHDLDINMQAAVVDVATRRSRISSLSDLVR